MAKIPQPPRTPTLQELGLRHTGVSIRELEQKRQANFKKPTTNSPSGVRIERLSFDERLKIFQQQQQQQQQQLKQ